ncbi:MAG TPA: stalk domain-containing protein [Armatimonadota bacterium]|nr:stalk domain-containing protein [Armatimonadota bacterium]
MKQGFAALSLVCLCIAAHADDGAVHGVGGTIAPMVEHPTVRMVREKVDAKLDWGGAKVRCEFVFKNEGPATTVKIGFPEKAWGEVGPIRRSDFSGFKSWVDGKRVSTRFVPSRKPPKEASQEFEAWHVKDVGFGAGQTRLIVNEYTCPLGRDSGGNRFFSYTLRSGKTWKGKIGEAIITVDASEVSSYYKVSPPESPKPYVLRGSRITWTLRDFEPDEDISVSLTPKHQIFIGGPATGSPVAVADPEVFGKHGVAMASVWQLRHLHGCSTSWDKVKRQCTITYGERSVELRPGSKTAILSKTEEIRLPRAPHLAEGRLVVPIINVAKALGMTVSYDQKRGWISILAPGSPNSEE